MLGILICCRLLLIRIGSLVLIRISLLVLIRISLLVLIGILRSTIRICVILIRILILLVRLLILVLSVLVIIHILLLINTHHLLLVVDLDYRDNKSDHAEQEGKGEIYSEAQTYFFSLFSKSDDPGEKCYRS